jgi:isohexenylglutaconyl-CoA hydratase
MLPDVEQLALEPVGDTLTIWFNRPDTRNALSAPMTEELNAVLEELPGSDYRFVVLRGRGGTFCAGGDLKMFRNVFQAGMSREDIVAFSAAFGRTLAAIRALPQLFVVVIEGAAMAGGLGIACLADVVISTRDARFALTEVTLGIPPAQIAPLVIERVGASEARRLLLTAQRFDGAAALELGMVHYAEADSDVLEERLAGVLADARRAAPGAIALTKQIIDSVAVLDEQARVQFAAERFADAMLGDEAREGMVAFAEKRPTRWAEPPAADGEGTP